MSGLVAVTRTAGGRSAESVELARSMARRLAHRGAVSEVLDLGAAAICVLQGSSIGRHKDVVAAVHGFGELPAADKAKLRLAPEAGSAEQVAAAVAEWGPHALDRVTGDFAALVLGATGELMVAGRDRSGLKPLVWREHGNSLLFASEAAALVDVASLERPRTNEGMIAEYLSGAPVNRTETMWSGVRRIEPRTRIVGSQGRHRIEHGALSMFECDATSPDEWDVQLHDVFVAAVERRLDTGTTAVELSGGLDSTTVLGVSASLRNGRDLLAAIRDYSGTQTDETEYWRAALERYDVDAQITPWDVELQPWMLSDAAATADRPCLPHLGPWRHELASLSNRGIRVSLTGQGGDERLGHSYQLPWALLAQGRLRSAYVAAQHHLGLDPPSAARALLTRGPRRLVTWYVPSMVPSGRNVRPRSWLREDLIRRVGLAERITRPRMDGTGMTVNELAGWAYGEIPNQYLEASERCAARQQIDLRHPFVDPELVELCLAIPEPVRTDPNDPRAAHRRVFGRYLPASVAERRSKADFTSQYVDRLAAEGILTSVDDSAVVANGWVDARWLDGALARLRRGENGPAALVSVLATVEAWARHWT